MQGTSVEIVCVNSLLPLFMSGVILHTAVKRQKSNSYFCMPTMTKEGFFFVTCVFLYANGVASSTFCVRICDHRPLKVIKYNLVQIVGNEIYTLTSILHGGSKQCV
jgi:hypothetical protein